MGFALTLVLAASSIPIVHFYQVYWTRLKSLPAAVATYEKDHGGRWTPLSRVSPWLTEALIATEDRTFYSNLGISFEGIGRALLVDLHTHQFTQGGSTLTQQLVRDTMLSPAKNFRRKISEALLALMITRLYSKQEILTLYLNEVYLGAGSYGIAQASQRYFGISPMRLTLPEAALIAGLPQAPSAYDPLVHYRAAKIRQDEVLNSMVQDHVISRVIARQAYQAPLPFKRPAGA
jgi:membrane peptidoglycan carboxypeptidase